jgi:hypothetical protein
MCRIRVWVLILLFLCPHTTTYIWPYNYMYMTSYYYICVRIQLHIYMSSYYYVCVLIPLYISSCYYICVFQKIRRLYAFCRISSRRCCRSARVGQGKSFSFKKKRKKSVLLLDGDAWGHGCGIPLYMCPRTTMYVSSYYCMCPHTYHTLLVSVRR